MKKSIALILILFGFLLPGLAAQEPNPDLPEDDFTRITYDTGDSVFSFGIGLLMPLFNSDNHGNFIPYGKQLGYGGMGYIEWNAYLTSRIRLGLQISGMFAQTINKNTLTMVPITAKFSYLLDFYPLTVPLTLGVGFSFNKLDRLFEFPPILKPGVGCYWSLRGNWELGGQVVYWWIPEIHFRDLADQTRFGNFLEISLGAVYHL
ncbi:MAG: hypothetical protein LBQ61_03000 [Spirochaetales bacterium]|nr:hypothetical protein [Spirochaetales bacterium]